MSNSHTRRPWSQFSARGLLLSILLLAVACGWFSSWRRVARTQREQEQRLRYADEELQRARDQLRDQARGKRPDPARSFWEAELAGSNLQGMTLASQGNAFQRASFRECRLADATLQGGVASFQFACFDGADLARASLTGGGASFQGATFVGADLTGATLTGRAASFQTASFEDAILVDAKLSGSFQLANIAGAALEGADLSAINGDDLASCYFDRPPTYNAQTKFPPGFDPLERLWRRAD